MERKVGYVIDIETGCFLCFTHKPDKDGYFPVKIDGKTELLHRVMYRKYNGCIPRGLVIRHTCDNPNCINPKHLQLGSHADNVRDRVERGRSARGEGHGRSKLTWEQVNEICSSDLSNSELARKYRVDSKAIRNIRNGITWKEAS